MLLAEWESIGATEPFPMEAADILLRHINATASEAVVKSEVGMGASDACDGFSGTSLEQPPQRYARKFPLKKCFRCVLEAAPTGAAGACPGNTRPNSAFLPKGPT